MELALVSIAFAACLVLAGVMGFAIQRGATCTVAAMDELVNRRRTSRLVSLLEAALWVGGGLAIADALSLLVAMPAGYAIRSLTIVGGVLLGLGAYVNGACVFGAIARLGSGEWAFVLTPLGFYVGCATIDLLALPSPTKLDARSPVLLSAMWLAAPVAAVMLARIVRGVHGAAGASARTMADRLREAITARLWSPHAATAVIGVTFLFMLLIAGAWAYTDVLAELAHGMRSNLAARVALLVALFAGSVIGGATAGRLRATWPTFGQIARRFAGGVLMGWGSLLIPGSNDGLILVGLPLLRPYAWLAFATMCATIGTAMVLANAARRSVLDSTRNVM